MNHPDKVTGASLMHKGNVLAPWWNMLDTTSMALRDEVVLVAIFTSSAKQLHKIVCLL